MTKEQEEILTAIKEAYKQGNADAFEKASIYIYHLGAHPDVNIDGNELVEEFKKYMEEQ